ncbi:Cbs2p RNJ42_02733 [Nakaseomyces bracarensis]|uniref:Cbs2p n=1 Tax=Nakaseomyces bracarensis TaxID=273131 RepID=UPI00387198F5
MSVPRVYTLGNVPLVSLLGYSIAKLPEQGRIPNVVMLLRDQAALDRFLHNDSKLSISNRGLVLDQVQTMASCSVPRYSDGLVAPMENIVLGGSNWMDEKNLMKSYRKAVTKDSTLLLLNPSFHTLDRLIDPNASKKLLTERPRVLWGWTGSNNTTKVVVKEEEFKMSIKKDELSIMISELPVLDNSNLVMNGEKETNTMLAVLQKLGSTSGVVNIRVENKIFNDQFIAFIEKYLIESIIEPLCVLNECRDYGELLGMKDLNKVIVPLMQEKITTFNKAYPFLSQTYGNRLLLDTSRISHLILDRIKSRPKTNSWAFTQLKILKRNELLELINFIPYLSNRNNLKIPRNMLLNHLVKGKIDIYCGKKLSS